MKDKINYRKDIDALRGLSIIAVVLYHSKLEINNQEIFSGGFLGVDIFFIITGYLITALLLKEFKSNNTIEILNFYKRRIKRLIPTLVVVLAFATFLAILILDPERLKDFSESIFASLTFTANAYFHYFGNFYEWQGNLNKPLLHMWSLGIEEQFYILYPIFLLFILKYLKKYFLILIILGFTLSLSFAEYASTNHKMFSFYMLPSRAWEILVGSLIAYCVIEKKFHFTINKFSANLLYLVSFSLILICIFTFKLEEIKHPSTITLLPLIAGSMIILIGGNKNKIFFYNLFSNRFLIYFGKISYSLYLWHFLFFAVLRNSFFKETFVSVIIVILISILFSIWSYKYIEKKHRDKLLDFNKTVKFISVFIFFIISINIFLLVDKKIIYERFNIDGVHLVETKDDEIILNYIKKNRKESFKADDKIKVLIVGNCHSDFSYAFLSFAQEKGKFQNYEFLLFPEVGGGRVEVSEFENIIDKKLKIYANANIILFSTRWRDEDLISLQKIINKIEEDNKKIILFDNIPEFNYSESKFGLKKILLTNYKKKIIEKKSTALSDNEVLNLKKIYFKQYTENKDLIKKNLFLENFARMQNIKLVKSSEYFCVVDKKQCNFRSEINKDELYIDYGRYSLTGLKILSDIVQENIFDFTKTK